MRIRHANGWIVIEIVYLKYISDSQFAGDADDYDSLEYGDDGVDSSPDLQA